MRFLSPWNDDTPYHFISNPLQMSYMICCVEQGSIQFVQNQSFAIHVPFYFGLCRLQFIGRQESPPPLTSGGIQPEEFLLTDDWAICRPSRNSLSREQPSAGGKPLATPAHSSFFPRWFNIIVSPQVNKRGEWKEWNESTRNICVGTYSTCRL
jgi:hypothetical protein